MAFARIPFLVAPAVLALALAGCSDDAPTRAAPGEPVSLSGQVMKGVTRNAVVTAYGLDDSGALVQVASGLSSGDGGFSLNLPNGFQGVLKIVASPTAPPEAPTEMRCDASSGCGAFVEATALDVDGDFTIDFGEWYPVGSDFSLRAVATVDGSGIRMVNLTPLSTLAADWAAMYPQGLDADSVLDANARIAAIFGFELADLEGALIDVTDPLTVGLADARTLQLSLLMAAFAEVARANAVTPEDFLGTAAAFFLANGGSLREAGDGEGPSLYDLFTGMQTVAGYIDMPDTTAGEVNAAIAGSLAALQDGAYSDRVEIDFDTMLGKLGPLGGDIDTLLGLTGLDDPAAFVALQLPQFEWLLAPSNRQIVPVAVEVVVYALLGSYQLDVLGPDAGVQTTTAGELTLELDTGARTLHVTGSSNGQALDLTLQLTGLVEGALAGEFEYGISGTLANEDATGSIEGTLVIDPRDTNLLPLYNAFVGLMAGNPASIAALQTALVNLAGTATADVTLVGTAQLTRTAEPGQVLSGSVNLTGFVDLGAVAGEDIARLRVDHFELGLPNGDRLYGLEGTPVLTVTVNDDATLQLDGVAELFNLTATGHAEGTLVNARALFEHVQDTLVGHLSGNLDELDVGVVISDLLDFDVEQLQLQGIGSVHVAETGNTYNASLDNLTVTVYQPNSTSAVAMTAMLDLQGQAVQMLIGEERWVLRALTTPTPRLVLVGESGEFMELSDAELISFIDTLPLGSLFAMMELP